MDLFDGKSTLGGTASRFRMSADGILTFHPAVLGRGYAIASQTLANRLRAGGVIFNLLCLVSIFVLRWDIVVWALVFLPSAWTCYTLINFFIVRQYSTTDTGQPERSPDIYMTVMCSGGALTSCLFGTLFYLNRWPSLESFIGFFMGESIFAMIVVAIFIVRKVLVKKNLAQSAESAERK